MLELIIRKFRLRLIQPEDFDALFIVILLHLLPDIFSAVRMGHIDKTCFSQLSDPFPILRTGQITKLPHLLIILALRIHGRPDGNHQLNAHLFQFPNHRRRIRPVIFIKFPITLVRPVEIIGNDHIDRQTSSLVFPRHFQYLFLCLITQLTLPEPHTILRHHRYLARSVRIGFLYLGRRIARRDPVVHLFCRFRHPFRHILTKCGMSDGRIVPQHAISPVREDERHAGLGIPVGQFDHAALQIQKRLLILSHTVQLLTVIRLKTNGQPIMIRALSGVKCARHDLQCTGEPVAPFCLGIPDTAVFL